MAAAIHDCADAATLATLLAADEVDAALEHGLMSFAPCSACDPAHAQVIGSEQSRLTTAWAARERYRKRKRRLGNRENPCSSKREAQAASITRTHALPPAVAQILARAKAKAAGKP